MTDDTQRQALARDIARRLQLASLDEVRVLDRLLVRIEQRREQPHVRWERRLPTTPFDRDRFFHLARVSDGVVVTMCRGRWPLGDAVELRDGGADPGNEGCAACRRAARREASDLLLDAVIDDVAAQLAAQDRDRAGLRAEAAAELAEVDRWRGLDRDRKRAGSEPYEAIDVDLGGEG